MFTYGFSSFFYFFIQFTLIVTSSLAFSTLLCVHLCPNLPLSIILLNSSRFFKLLNTFPLCIISITKKFIIVNMFSTPVITFIKCQNRYHTKNNIRYKSNINKSTSYANSTKLPAMVLCSGEPPGGFCDVGCCCCFSSLEVFTILGYFSLPPALHPGFSGP